jgi:ribonuclease HII
MLILPAYLDPDLLEAGCDEAGRGCLAGPVFAAAVILPRDFAESTINDSKQLSKAQRYAARTLIEREALAWAVAAYSPAEIDTYNILRASYLAMHRALDQLTLRPEQLLIDGNRFIPYGQLPYHCIVKGDGKYASIAAAGILAKTYRDDHMHELHQQYPHYGWERNKGYPTREHRAAIQAHGATEHHRRSFRLLPDGVQQKLF